MANYNRGHFKLVDGKPIGSDIMNIKKSRADKVFPYKEPIDNPMNNDKYKSTQSRRKELNEERIITTKNSNEMTNEEKMRENLMKNKMYNEKMKNKAYGNPCNINNANNAGIKKKKYYEQYNNNTNDYDDYMNPPNHLVDEMASKNMNINCMDRKVYDENTIMKDRLKYRRIDNYNEDMNLHENNTNDVMYSDLNTNANLQRNYNDYNKAIPHNKDLVLKNTKPGMNREHFSKRTFQGNYEYNEKGYETYEGSYNKNNVSFAKNKEYNNYVGNDGTVKFPKLNNRNPKVFGPKDTNDSMIVPPVASSSIAITAPATFAQKDLAYRRHGGNNEVNPIGGKEVPKAESLNKEGMDLGEEGENVHFENDSKINMRVPNNANKEFSRGKNMPLKNMAKGLGKNVIPTSSSASTDITVMGLNQKGAVASIYKENMSGERNTNTNLTMHKNPPMKHGVAGTVGKDMYSQDMYSQKYPPKGGDINKTAHPHILEKEGHKDKDKSAEYQNASLSTIDSNQSNTNGFETVYPKAPNLLDTHGKPMKNEAINLDGNAKSGEYDKEEKAKKDIGHKGMAAPRNYMYAQEYDYNFKKSASKKSFKMDETTKDMGYVEKVTEREEREKIMLDETEPIKKKYEYSGHMNRESPEFGKDRHVNLTAGGNNFNELGNNKVMYEGRGENNMIKENVVLDNFRDYKTNINRYSPYDSPPFESSSYDSPPYEEKMLRKHPNMNVVKDKNFLTKNVMHYPKLENDEYCKYQSSDSYDEKSTFPITKDGVVIEKEYSRTDKRDYYNNTGYNKMNYKYKGERIERNERNDRNIGRSGLIMDSHVNRLKENYKGNKYISNSSYKNYSPNCYMDEEEISGMGHMYNYRNEPYVNTDLKQMKEMRNYGGNYAYDSSDDTERKGSLTVVRLPAENKKQVKKKKRKVLGDNSCTSIVDIYSTAVPLSDNADSYVIKALSQDEPIDDNIYALIPKSVKEVVENGDVTHVTLNSPTSLFINPDLNVKQHILTSDYQNGDISDESSPCIFPLSEDQLKERSGGADGDKNLKSIIRGASLRNKSGSSLSVKFKLEDTDRDKKEGKKSVAVNEEVDISKDLIKKIENYIPEEIKNIKIDKKTTEKRRASIFDESKGKSKNEKKKDFSNKIVLDSNKVKKATEIKLKRVQEVTGLFEKYGIPNPFETYYMEKINYDQLIGLNEEAKLFNLALTVSNNYCKYIRKRLDRAEENRVFNQKRKIMFIKVVELLGQQINTEIKKKFMEVNVAAPISKEMQKEKILKNHLNAKEREIKVEEHNLVCKYWDKQSECMSLLIKEWNKICEILESLNIDPNNIIGSLTSIYGERAVIDYKLSADEIATRSIELDIDLEDLTIPNWGTNEHMEMFDPSNMTVSKLIQDIKWDMDIEYSLNQIRADWTNQNKQNKKRVQKKIIEGIKHRVELIDYLNNVELNLNAFAKLIEGRIISKDDVKSQLMSMQDFQETGALANILKKLRSDRNEFLSESGKTPASFFTTHHFPLTNTTISDNSQDNDKKEKEKKEKQEKKEKKENEIEEEQASEKSGNSQNAQNEETAEVQEIVENNEIQENDETDGNHKNNNQS